MRPPAFDPRRRYPALDGLRGMAILLVILSHATVIAPANRLEQILLAPAMLGWCGVDLFFVLSGFLITSILLQARGGRGYFESFYARRILRIFPLYYALLLLVLVLLPQVPHPKSAEFAGVDNQWTYWLFLSNFKNAVDGHFGHPILAVTWSLAIEEQFYLLWPAVVLLAGARGLRYLCPMLVVGSLACRLVLLHGYQADPVALYTLTPCRLDGLAIGSLLAALVYEGWQPGRHAKALAWVAAACYLAVLVSEAVRPFAPPGSAYTYSHFACGPGFTLLSLSAGALLLLVLNPDPHSVIPRVLESKLLRSFGKYSFGIYLLHLPVRAAFRDVVFGPGVGPEQTMIPFPQLGGSQLPGQLLFYPPAFALCWATGWLSWKLLESPIMRLKQFFPYPPNHPTQGDS